MKSNKVRISGKKANFESILEETQAFAYNEDLPDKASLQLQLLAEEIVSLMRAISFDYEGTYMVSGENGKYELTVEGETLINPKRKKDLMSIATKQKPSTGVLNRIKNIFEGFMTFTEEAAPSGDTANIMYMTTEIGDMQAFNVLQAQSWSLKSYRQQVEESLDDEDMKAGWEELERSIIANLADDVTVEIKASKVLITVYKEFK